MIENNEGWMTGAEVGRMLRLAPGTLNNWRSAGRGPKYVKLAGGVGRYPEADVKAWSDAQRLGRAAWAPGPTAGPPPHHTTRVGPAPPPGRR